MTNASTSVKRVGKELPCVALRMERIDVSVDPIHEGPSMMPLWSLTFVACRWRNEAGHADERGGADQPAGYDNDHRGAWHPLA
jgi:hypothetical protein